MSATNLDLTSSQEKGVSNCKDLSALQIIVPALFVLLVYWKKSYHIATISSTKLLNLLNENLASATMQD